MTPPEHLPLPQGQGGHTTPAPLSLDAWLGGAVTDDRNPGLWYDKYIDAWQRFGPGDWRVPEANKRENYDGGKVVFLKRVRDFGAGAASRLAAYLARRESLIAGLGGGARCFVTVSPWVSGLGSGHPLETGLIWHPTLGVPYLPGSGVKGVLHCWAARWGALSDQGRIRELFGSEETEDVKGSQGKVIVFDAIPCHHPRLTLDIMTPHYAPYYQDPDKDPPGDWHSPIPIPFLAVAPGQRFNFALAALPEADNRILGEAWCLLGNALATLGGGGKTAVGYGLFRKEAGTDMARGSAT